MPSAHQRVKTEVSTESGSDRVGEVGSLNEQSTIQLLEPTLRSFRAGDYARHIQLLTVIK
ncbi:MAG: hypothetical protein DMF71_04000 [Acidobacteria bacterium]|nr:MAG: hypothetical protein DMF71_04000 [Acidobacteriota bacterium]